MKPKLRQLFEAGKYSKILVNDRPRTSDEMVFWLGALVFTGREDEARLLLTQTKWRAQEEVECSFYILLTSLRRSNYKDMRKDFWYLYQICSKHRSHNSKFFISQGLGLLRYYKGEFGKAYEYSHQAFQESLIIERDYTSMIALDLMGHAQCMMEQYSQGIEYFEESLRFAKRISNNQNSKVIDLSIMTYKIEAGRDLINVERELNHWISSIKVDDYFTRTNALILKAKILQLQGLFGEAEELLTEVGNDVFTLNQGRQILNYNLCLGISRCIVDGPSRCLSLIKTSTKLCDQGQDSYFLHRFKEVENYILNEEGKKTDKKGLEHLALVTGRSLKSKFPLAIVPEELVSDVFKKERSFPLGSGKVRELADKGLLGLIRLAGFYNKSDEFIDLTLSDRNILFYMDNNLSFVDDLSTKQYELLMILLEKEVWSRKELFERFWQISYDAFVHDNKIYVTLKRLRQKLGRAHILINLDKGKILIRKTFVYRRQEELAKESPEYKSTGEYLGLGLNPRQIDFLNWVESGDIMTPQKYGDKYSISRNTVTRDLGELVRKGYLKKFGKQKGTFYCRD